MEINLSKNLQTRGCPVCDHLEEQLFHFTSHFQHALASDEKTQEDFAGKGGFCSFHVWQLAAFSSDRGLARGLPALLLKTADDLAKLAEDPSRLDSESRVFINDSFQCPVCNLLRQVEGEYVHLLADLLQKEDGRLAYLSSQGVCLRHLKQLLEGTNADEMRRFLLSVAAHRFRDTANDLNQYARKHEALQRHAFTRDEKDAVRRALIHIAGAKNIFPLS